MTPDPDEHRMVSLADAARAFGRDPSAFRHAVRLGRLAAVRPGREWLTTIADAAEYVACQQPGHHPRRRRTP